MVETLSMVTKGVIFTPMPTFSRPDRSQSKDRRVDRRLPVGSPGTLPRPQNRRSGIRKGPQQTVLLAVLRQCPISGLHMVLMHDGDPATEVKSALNIDIVMAKVPVRPSPFTLVMRKSLL